MSRRDNATIVAMARRLGVHVSSEDRLRPEELGRRIADAIKDRTTGEASSRLESWEGCHISD